MQNVQNYCFSLINMQICDILVAIVLVELELPNNLQSFTEVEVNSGGFLASREAAS